MLDVAFAAPALPSSGALVLLIGEDARPSGLWARADEATDGAVARAFEAAEFKGAKGKSCTILAPGAGLSRIVAVGLGKAADLSSRVLEEAGGHAAAALG
ncbi:MAG: M17 family peptidase N-terminal domain-containing protein, partial [Acetobacteraceae bacterium]